MDSFYGGWVGLRIAPCLVRTAHFKKKKGALTGMEGGSDGVSSFSMGGCNVGPKLLGLSKQHTQGD